MGKKRKKKNIVFERTKFPFRRTKGGYFYYGDIVKIKNSKLYKKKKFKVLRCYKKEVVIYHKSISPLRCYTLYVPRKKIILVKRPKDKVDGKTTKK